MYPVTVQHSLLVAFLLSLKGSYVHSAEEICAPVGSTALLSCPYTCSKKYIWTLDGKHINHKSDQNKYSVNEKNCSLTIQSLKKMDGGTYRYCETDDDDDDDCIKRCRTTLYVTDASRITTVSSVRSLETRAVTLTYNTLTPPPDVMIDSTGLIILSSLLVLLMLMMIGAAVWRRRNNLRRCEGNESQSTNPSPPYTVYENFPAAPIKHQRQKTEESDDKDDVQYRSVHVGKNAHRPARVDDVQYAEIKVSARSEEQQYYTLY